MFHDQQLDLVRRQAELVTRSRSLRANFAQDALALQRPFALLDRVRSGFRWLAANPHWVLIALAAPLLLRPRKIAGWTLKAFAYWRVWRRAQRAVGLLALFNSPGKRWRAR